jgi:hypothetical protein
MIMQITPATSCVQRSRPTALPVVLAAILAMDVSYRFLVAVIGWAGRSMRNAQGSAPPGLFVSANSPEDGQ